MRVLRKSRETLAEHLDWPKFSTNYKHLLTFHLFLGTHIIIHGKNDESHKLATSQIDTNLQFDNIPGDALLDIAVENIDVNRLRKQVDEILLTQENTPRPIETRRAPYFDFQDGLQPYYQAETARVRRRIVDNMVQLLYMARYSLRKMQSSSYYNPTDTTFRMAYAYRTGQKYLKKINIAYKIALHHVPIWRNASYQLIMHSKIVQNHIDYVYAYWVGVNIDHAMKQYTRTKQRVNAARLKKQQIRENQLNQGNNETGQNNELNEKGKNKKPK
ncbi:unnamed protein product [Arctia plantaginis]|uniref:Uncharacterized protein n=1 Tax=Arctia plantaginis TaxID=874455 RepID=A0A8S1BJI3_ARCPL|nr:unnamed protein product [Arctia plantaginis]